MSSGSRRVLRSDSAKSKKLIDYYEGQRTPLKGKRKTALKSKSGPKRKKNKCQIFDANGIHIESGLDLCDCLDIKCGGCFFECPNKNCKSNKCGTDCRQNRKYYYESIEDEFEQTKKTNQIVN